MAFLMTVSCTQSFCLQSSGHADDNHKIKTLQFSFRYHKQFCTCNFPLGFWCRIYLHKILFSKVFGQLLYYLDITVLIISVLTRSSTGWQLWNWTNSKNCAKKKNGLNVSTFLCCKLCVFMFFYPLVYHIFFESSD